MTHAWPLVFAVVLVVCWLATVLGWPGNWLMVLVAGAYAYGFHEGGRAEIGRQTVAAMFVIALVGEALEFAAASFGVTRAGGSKRSSRLAIVGSIVGGIVGIFVGLPVPVVGSLAGALLFASAGAFIGATIGEVQQGGSLTASFRIGKAAFVGRLLGALGKIAAGTAILIVGIVALVV